MSAAHVVWLRETTVPQERLACGRTRVLAAMREATVVPVCNTAMKSKASAVIERSRVLTTVLRAELLREDRPAEPCVIATVYPEVYPSDMPPLLAHLEPSHEYIRPH